MMKESELNKLKDAIRKMKNRASRPSKPDGANWPEDPKSPGSFHLDDIDADMFWESFIIDTGNKELEERLEKLEEELKAAHDMNNEKNKEIVVLQEQIDKLEDQAKQGFKESFEFMNSENLKHIKGTLIQYLKNVPFTVKSNETLLDVVFDMLYMTKEEIREIREARSLLKKVTTPKKKSTGIFSRMLN